MGNPVITPTPPAAPAASPISPPPSPTANPGDLLSQTLAPFLTPDGPATQPPTFTPPQDPQAPQAPVAEAPEIEAGAAGDAEEEEKPEDLDAPPGSIEVASTRGQEIWADHRLMAQLAKPPQEGGIGFKPTVDQIRGFMADHQSWTNLMLDLESGDPTAVRTAMQFLTQRAPAATPQLGAALREVAPDAYNSLYEEVIDQEVQSIVDMAREFSDEASRKYWFQVANGLAYIRNRQGLDPNILNQPPSARGAKPAANSLEERERRVQEAERRAQGAQIQSFFASAVQEREAILDSFVNPILDRTSLTPEIKAIVGRELKERVVKGIEANSSLASAVEVEIRRARQSGGDPNILQGVKQRLLGIYQQAAGPIIQREAKVLVRKANASTPQVAAAAKATAQLSNARGDVVPAGPPAASAPANPTQLPPRNKGENSTDWTFRALGGILQ